jgi:hypothetical protein
MKARQVGIGGEIAAPEAWRRDRVPAGRRKWPGVAPEPENIFPATVDSGRSRPVSWAVVSTGPEPQRSGRLPEGSGPEQAPPPQLSSEISTAQHAVPGCEPAVSSHIRSHAIGLRTGLRKQVPAEGAQRPGDSGSDPVGKRYRVVSPRASHARRTGRTFPPQISSYSGPPASRRPVEWIAPLGPERCPARGVLTPGQRVLVSCRKISGAARTTPW